MKHKEHQEGTKITKIKTIIKTLCPEPVLKTERSKDLLLCVLCG